MSDMCDKLLQEDSHTCYRSVARCFHPTEVVVITFCFKEFSSQMILQFEYCVVNTKAFLLDRGPLHSCRAKLLRYKEQRHQFLASFNFHLLKQHSTYSQYTSICSQNPFFRVIGIEQFLGVLQCRFEFIENTLIVLFPFLRVPVEVFCGHLI